MTNIDQPEFRLLESVPNITKAGYAGYVTYNPDKGNQPHEEPSAMDLIQIPLPPLRHLAGPPLALLPIQGIARLYRR